MLFNENTRRGDSELNFFDLCFSITSPSEISDRTNYWLYSAIKTQDPELLFSLGFRFFIDLKHRAIFIRILSSELGELLSLLKKNIYVRNLPLNLIYEGKAPVSPSQKLFSPIVVIKKKGVTSISHENFLESCQNQLTEKGINATIGIPKENGQYIRKSLPVKQTKNYGYSLKVGGLTEENSLKLQIHGIGGKQKMGGGWFEPI